MEFSLNVFTEFAEVSDKKKLKLKRKIAGLEPRISCVRDRDSITQQSRADLHTEPNSCLIDFSDSLNSLNSLKVLLHLEKTPMLRVWCCDFTRQLGNRCHAGLLYCNIVLMFIY